MDRNRSRSCVRECPCFPRCDEMMEENQMGMPSQSQMGMQPGQMLWGMQPGQMSWQNQMDMTQVPWAGGIMQSDLEMENEQDWERLKELYPEMARMIQRRVEDACDKLEYEGSAMFDTVPDKTRVRDMAQEIMQMLEGQISAEEVEEQPDLYTMNREPCRNCRPNQNFLGDFVEVMIFNEMFRRRCRHRHCRRW